MPHEKTDEIKGFFGDNRWLSNFWICDVPFENRIWKSSEHAYVSAKTTDEDVKETIFNLDTPGKVKRYGRTMEIRGDWDEIKLNCMRKNLLAKFSYNRNLRDKLLSTYPMRLIEENTWGDTFWGECNGKGSNHLGKTLEWVRFYYTLTD